MTIKRKNRGGRIYLEEYRNVRRGKKVISEFVRYLGPEDKEQERGYGSVLDRIQHGPSVHSGAVRLLWRLAQDLKFKEIINRICSKNCRFSEPTPGTLLTIWAINRILRPTSASKLGRWVSITDLPDITCYPVEVFTKDAFLQALDAVCRDDPALPDEINNTLEIDRALSEHWRKEHPLPPGMKQTLAYDLTNVLFFGVKCPLAKKGRNVKHERRRQVNVAVAVNQYDHAPLLHFVYRGNRNGARTVRNLLAQFQKLELPTGLLTVDRGIMGSNMISEARGVGWHILGGISKGEKAKDILQGTEIPETPQTYVRESKAGPVYAMKVNGSIFGENRELVVYKNAEKAMRDREERNKALARIGTALTSLSTKGESWSEAELHQAIKAIVDDWKDFLHIRVSRKRKSPRIMWKYLDRSLRAAARQDGKYLLLCTDTLMSAKDAVETYFNKDYVEKLFRILKNDISVEPVRHRLGPRVRAYIFVCMLAYRLMMALRWKLIESGVDEKTMEYLDRLLEELWEVERLEVSLSGQKKTWYLNVTEFIEEGLRKTGMKKLLVEQ